MKPNSKPAAAIPVVEAEPEPAEIVGGRWDGLSITVPLPMPQTISRSSAELDTQACMPVSDKHYIHFVRRTAHTYQAL
jgi:hypothetical protein